MISLIVSIATLITAIGTLIGILITGLVLRGDSKRKDVVLSLWIKNHQKDAEQKDIKLAEIHVLVNSRLEDTKWKLENAVKEIKVLKGTIDELADRLTKGEKAG